MLFQVCSPKSQVRDAPRRNDCVDPSRRSHLVVTPWRRRRAGPWILRRLPGLCFAARAYASLRRRSVENGRQGTGIRPLRWVMFKGPCSVAVAFCSRFEIRGDLSSRWVHCILQTSIPCATALEAATDLLFVVVVAENVFHHPILVPEPLGLKIHP